MRVRLAKLSLSLMIVGLLCGCAEGGDVVMLPQPPPPMPKWKMSAPPYSNRPPIEIGVSTSEGPLVAARAVVGTRGDSLPFWEQDTRSTRSPSTLSESARHRIASEIESFPLTVVQAYTTSGEGRPAELWDDTRATGWWLAVVGELDLSAAFWITKENQQGASWKYYTYAGPAGPLFEWFSATDVLRQRGWCDDRLSEARLYVLDNSREFIACRDASETAWVALARYDDGPLQFPDARESVGAAPFPAERLVDNLE